MKMMTQPTFSSPRRGGALTMVLMVTFVVAIIGGSILRFGITEMRVNDSFHTRVEAQNVAESLLDYGIAQLQRRWSQNRNFSYRDFVLNPLDIPDSVYDLFADGNIEVGDLELMARAIPLDFDEFSADELVTGVMVYFDPDDALHQKDPLAGKMVMVREVEVLARATVRTRVGERPVTAFVRQTFEVRDMNFLNHVMFFNMELALHPGADMVVDGPIHTNSHGAFQASQNLWLKGRVTAAGNIYHGRTQSDGIGNQFGHVFFKNADNQDVSMRLGGTNTNPQSWMQYNHSNYIDGFFQRWQGNVMGGDHGAPLLNPPGILEYVPENLETPEIERRNSAYALLEPQIADHDPAFKGDVVRQQQFSYQAGLIVRVADNPVPPPPADADPADIEAYQPYVVNFFKYVRDSDGNALRGADGRPIEYEVEVDNVDALVALRVYEEDADGRPVQGMFDYRQERSFNLVEINVGVLREAIHQERTDIFRPGAGPNYFNPGQDWNGVVYVETPFDTAPAADRPDRIVTARGDLAVRLHNAERIPDPFPDSGIRGMTLATNAPMYILGHYNADGDPATGSSVELDNADEAPAALAADAITVLSNNWDDSMAKEKLSPDNSSGWPPLTGIRDAAAFTETSAAMITGLAAVDGHKYSMTGGAHNFMRYLENHWGRTHRFRGSLVSLFDSEISDIPLYHYSNRGHARSINAHYLAPNRDYGFNRSFQNGVFPPGIPLTRSFARTNFQFLSEEEYNARKTVFSELDKISGSL